MCHDFFSFFSEPWDPAANRRTHISPAVCRQIWVRAESLMPWSVLEPPVPHLARYMKTDQEEKKTLPFQCCCCSISNVCFPQGDSGGPLVCECSGVWTLVGSVSWEKSTCDPRFPAVYARISQLRSWIDRTIALEHQSESPRGDAVFNY